MRLIRTWLAKRRMAKLSEARRVCCEAFDAAVIRGDSRAQHSAYEALKSSTHALMREEVAFRAGRSKARRRSAANGWRGISFQ